MSNKRYEIIDKWIREDSRDHCSNIVDELVKPFRGRLHKHELAEIHNLFVKAFYEGYFDGRGDEDCDGYYYELYIDLEEAGEL